MAGVGREHDLGVPRYDQYDDEILLGDIVISNSVVQYDLGRSYTDKFVRKDTLDGNLRGEIGYIRSLLRVLETEQGRDVLQLITARSLVKLQERASKTKRPSGIKFKYGYPGTMADRLFSPYYLHKHHHLGIGACNICDRDRDDICDDARRASCQDIGCDERQLITRQTLQGKQELEKESVREAQEPTIHIGAIAMGDSIMKCGRERDEVSIRERCYDPTLKNHDAVPQDNLGTNSQSGEDRPVRAVLRTGPTYASGPYDRGPMGNSGP